MKAEKAVPEWWKEIYDDLRQRTGFGNLSEERTVGDVVAVERFLSLRPPAKVLDLFCGTGRHCIELAKRGYDVVGLDYSADYLALGQQRAQAAGVSPRWLQGDARAIAFGSGYEAVIVMWASFGFFDDEGDREIVKKIHRALAPGGGLYMEVKNRDWEILHFTPTGTKQVGDIRVSTERDLDLIRSRIDTTLTFQRGEERWTRFQSWRLYSAHEFRYLLESEGLEISGVYGDSRGGEFSLESHLMRVVAHRPRK